MLNRRGKTEISASLVEVASPWLVGREKEEKEKCKTYHENSEVLLSRDSLPHQQDRITTDGTVDSRVYLTSNGAFCPDK
jgi:hypothetical protein